MAGVPGVGGGFFAGLTGGLGQGAQNTVNKMLDLRTAGYRSMADMYLKLAQMYPQFPGLTAQYLEGAKANIGAAANPMNRVARQAADSFTNPGEPLQNQLNQLVDQGHRDLTGGTPAPPEALFKTTPQTTDFGKSVGVPSFGVQQSPSLGSGTGSQIPSISSPNGSGGTIPPAPVSGTVPQQIVPPSGSNALGGVLGQILGNQGMPQFGPYYDPQRGVLLSQDPRLTWLSSILPELSKPMAVKPGESVYIPLLNSGQGNTAFRAPIDPGFMTTEQQAVEVASKGLATRYGINLDPTKSALSQLPTTVQEEAVTRGKQLLITPEQKEMWASMGLSRQALAEMERWRAVDTQQRVMEFNVRMKSGTDLAHDTVFNPQLLTDPRLDQTIRSFAISEMQKSGYPVPASIPQPLVQQEEFINNARNHGRQILDVLQRYPNVVGPAIGRLTRFDQLTGAPIFTDAAFPQGDPRRGVAQAIQNSIAYMFTNEVRSAMPGRPAIQYIDILRKASANPSQAPEILKPLVQAMMNAANVAEYGINGKRYGTPRLPVPDDIGEQFIQAAGGNASLAKEMAANAGFLVPGFNDPATIQKAVSSIRE